MATTVSRDLGDIKSEVTALNAELRNADSTVRKLNGDLKLDPNNVVKLKEKFALLSNELESNRKKITTLKEQQKLLNEKMSEASGAELKNYQKEMQKVNKQLETAENKSKELNAALSLQNKTLAEAKYNNIISGLDKFESKAKKASMTALTLTAALVACVKVAVDTGDELSDTSAKLNTTVEGLQKGRYIYDMLADGADGYDAALTGLASSMTSISKGRGAAYISTLQKIGLSSKELMGLNTGEQLELVTEALSHITSEADRTQYAMTLMGEAGRSVALIAATDSDTIADYNAKLEAAGLITADMASKGDELANRLSTVKQSVMYSALAITAALMPAIETLVDIMQTTIIPILNGVAGFLDGIGTGGQKVLLLILLVIIVLPKLVAIVKTIITVVKALHVATLTQAGAFATLQTSGLLIWTVLAAVAAIVLLLIKLFSWLTKSTNEASDALGGFNDTYGEFQNTDLSKIGIDPAALSENGLNMKSSLESSTKTITSHKEDINLNVNVSVTADGETAVSDETAGQIAELVADRVNERLGELTYGNP